MDLSNKLKKCAVIGSAGKMGSGISLLLLQEIADIENAKLILIDLYDEPLIPLKGYLRTHLTKYAEKNINRLREKYKEVTTLIDNSDIILHYVNQALDRVEVGTSLEACKECYLIFEAIIEDVEIKVDLFKKLKSIAVNTPFYFSNTSSIPISLLEEKSGITSYLIGYHFYNPPAVQKLVEIVIPTSSQHALKEIAFSLGEKLQKTLVQSGDVPGFIGNGHFIREIHKACEKVAILESKMNKSEAISLINQITQDFLIRPMGIFQLIDYVGIDVCHHIATIMDNHILPKIIDEMLLLGVKGGQNPDGSQKPGFFSYHKGSIVKVFDFKTKSYIDIIKNCDPLPKEHIPWKKLSQETHKSEKLKQFFINLKNENSMSAEIAWEFLENSKKIAELLVTTQVAKSIHDVDTVLKFGFFHLYGSNEAFHV